MEDVTDLFGQIQEILEEIENEELPVEIFKDIPEEYAELYHELNDAIANFFVECIKHQPYGSTNELLTACIEFLHSKGITGKMVDQLFSPADVDSYNWDHSFLFLSLGKNDQQSAILKEFGCSLDYDLAQARSGEPNPYQRASLQLKIDHYNRIFPERITLGGKRRSTKRRRSKKYKKNYSSLIK
jgi:hypothetical protein